MAEVQKVQNNQDLKSLQISNYDFHLPKNAIAKYPKPRGQSKLMLVKKNANGEDLIEHKQIFDLPKLLQKNDLLIFNDTKVIPARIIAQKTSGGKLEIMVERILPERQILAQIKNGKSLKKGQEILLPNSYKAIFLERQDSMFLLELESAKPILDLLQEIGEIPLPPYIDRKAEDEDKQTYQTIFAHKAGAVAAPTAGLHFTDEILAELSASGIAYDFVTLHIGAGTFQPIKCENILEHKMHAEWLEVSQKVVDKIKQTKAKGGRVICVGTTSVRSIETMANASGASIDELKPYSGFSQIFIYPSYKWQIVDGIFTNFHLPKSSLLLLVSAFKSKDIILKAYAEALKNGYKFFSYGDALLLI